jgi:hypothetical protein
LNPTHQALHGLFFLQEIVRRDTGLFEDGQESAFRHVSGMIGDCGVSVGLLVVPDFMTPAAWRSKAKPSTLNRLAISL